MKMDNKSQKVFKENCGNDSNLIAFLSLSIGILLFDLFSNTIEGTVNVKSFDFFIVKITFWFVFAVSISTYYYKIKHNRAV